LVYGQTTTKNDSGGVIASACQADRSSVERDDGHFIVHDIKQSHERSSGSGLVKSVCLLFFSVESATALTQVQGDHF
jgi:hypothetical protein